jgi:hypothetical protein
MNNRTFHANVLAWARGDPGREEAVLAHARAYGLENATLLLPCGRAVTMKSTQPPPERRMDVSDIDTRIRTYFQRCRETGTPPGEETCLDAVHDRTWKITISKPPCR